MMDAGRLAPSPESVGIDPQKLEDLFDRAEREVREGLLPSMQIAVARHGRLAGMRSFGRVERQGVSGPATDDTLYCIFSCTKAITSAAASPRARARSRDMRLVYDGRSPMARRAGFLFEIGRPVC